MNWYYAENNERRGPIDESTFARLVTTAAIKPETLVWREGMAAWAPFSQSGYTPPLPGGETPPPPVGGVPMGVCSESGRILPRTELVEIDGRLVSAEYKNVVLQRIREGLGASGAAGDPEALAQQVLARGYNINIGSCIGRGWAMLKGNFWMCVGASFLTMLVSQAAGFVPIIGPIIVYGPLTAGMYLIALKLLRRESATVGDAFQGFSTCFSSLLGVGALMICAIIVAAVPVGIAVAVAAVTSQKEPSIAAIAIAVLLGIAFIFVLTYLMIAWLLALPLVIDKRLDAMAALKLSRRVVGMHWWQWFGLLFVIGLMLGGVMVLGLAVVGLAIFALSKNSAAIPAAMILFIGVAVLVSVALRPIANGAIMAAYEDIFSPDSQR